MGEMDEGRGCGGEGGQQEGVEGHAYRRRGLVDGVDVCGT